LDSEMSPELVAIVHRFFLSDAPPASPPVITRATHP
jgi:hypothetical protein